MISGLLTLLAQTIKDPDTSINIPRADVGPGTVTNVLKLAFGVAGGIALIIITLSGLKFALANGDPNSVAKAKNAIIYALLGLVVCISGYSIINFVVTNV